MFFHDLIHLLLLCGEIGHIGPRCGYDLSLTPRVNHEEDKFLGLRDDLPALIGRDQIELGGIASGILYNFLFKVIITLRGLDSYTK